MMILTRKRCESVVVGRPNGFERMLKVTVLEINGDSVLLGFETNDDFPVQSWEMWERIRAPLTSAVQGDMTTNRRF